MTKPPEKSKVVRKLRCAIYTRKSSEEGLEQEFNSLHAQREACEAYIARPTASPRPSSSASTKNTRSKCGRRSPP